MAILKETINFIDTMLGNKEIKMVLQENINSAIVSIDVFPQCFYDYVKDHANVTTKFEDINWLYVKQAIVDLI